MMRCLCVLVALATILLPLFVHAKTTTPLYTTTFNIDSFFLTIQDNGRNALTFGTDVNNPYILSFTKFAEYSTETNTTIPGTNVSLSGAWTIANVTHANNSVKFDMLFEYRSPNVIVFGFTVIFPNATTDDRNKQMCSGAFCFKFNVTVPQYKWITTTGAPKLALLFNLTGPVSDTVATNKTSGLTVSLGQSFFQITPNATAANNSATSQTRTINVNLNYVPTTTTSIGSLEPGIWVIYDNFPDLWSLTHDPSVGFNPTTVAPNTVNIDIVIGLLISGGVILIVVVLGVIYLYRQKQVGYMTLGN